MNPVPHPTFPQQTTGPQSALSDAKLQDRRVQIVADETVLRCSGEDLNSLGHKSSLSLEQQETYGTTAREQT
jgi:hypothetical protein